MQWLFGRACEDHIGIWEPSEDATGGCCSELLHVAELVRQELLPPGPLSCREVAPEAYRLTCEGQGPNYLAAFASTLGFTGHVVARALTSNWDGGLVYYVLPFVPVFGRLLRLLYTFALLRGPHATRGSCLFNAYPDWCRCNRIVTGANPCAWQWRDGGGVWQDYPPDALRQIQLAMRAKRPEVRVARAGRWRRIDLRGLTETDELTGQRSAEVRFNDQTSVLGIRLLRAPIGYAARRS